MKFDFGGFLFFNALCDWLDKASEPPSEPDKPMPPHVKLAVFVSAICFIGTLLIIMYMF